MSSNGREIPWVNGALFNENWNKLPPEYLEPYAGQRVAFNFEGTQILAAGADYEALYAKLIELGINPERVVIGYIPEPWDDTWL